MIVKSTRLYPHPGYEAHVAMMLSTDAGGNASLQEIQKTLREYHLGEGTVMRDIQIPGMDPGQEIRLHLIIPAGLPEKSPVILDIHGGGFVTGDVEIDNYRNIYLAEHTPCIVAAVEYRLATAENTSMDLLNDCYAAFTWLREHAEEIGGDPERIGVHGTSAGGNLSAGLALYLRDRGEKGPCLTVINCPLLRSDITTSKRLFGSLGAPGEDFAHSMESMFTKPHGMPPTYYEMPGTCGDVRGLGPHMVVVAEYDPLRDEGLQYALKLLDAGVPCEMICAPRVTHGFCVVDEELTRWTHDGICASFRREFNALKQQ